MDRLATSDYFKTGFSLAIPDNEGTSVAPWYLFDSRMSANPNFLQLQALRLMQVVIPTGIEKREFFEKIIEKLFLILGNIAIFCHPNLPLHKFGI